jgi:hypothetical protein
MSIWTTLLDAAAQGVKAKAEHSAMGEAYKQQAKNEPSCSPCAANAAVERYMAEARARAAPPSTKGRR